MALVVFYEKPGCITNARQKRMLVASGHQLEVRDLLTTHWTPENLQLFLGELEVGAWFNRSAPAIKSGQIDPDRMDPRAALDLLCYDPLLIRRPLLSVGDQHRAGFVDAEIHDWIGLSDPQAEIGDTCARVSPVSSGS